MFKRPRELELAGIVAVAGSVGITYYFARQFDSAIEQFRKALEIEPGHGPGHVLLAEAYACAGQREKSLKECEEALAVGHGAALVRLNVACTYAKLGRTEEARKILQEAESEWKSGSPLPFLMAGAHARLGEKDAAFEWLEKAFQVRDGLMLNLKVHPAFDVLHDDLRFNALLKRIGIPD